MPPPPPVIIGLAGVGGGSSTDRKRISGWKRMQRIRFYPIIRFAEGNPLTTPFRYNPPMLPHPPVIIGLAGVGGGSSTDRKRISGWKRMQRIRFYPIIRFAEGNPLTTPFRYNP